MTLFMLCLTSIDKDLLYLSRLYFLKKGLHAFEPVQTWQVTCDIYYNFLQLNFAGNSWHGISLVEIRVKLMA